MLDAEHEGIGVKSGVAVLHVGCREHVGGLVDGLAAEGAEVRILTLSSDLHSYTKGNVTYLGSVGVGRIYPNARLKAAPSSRYVQELVKWRPDIVHSQCEFSTFSREKDCGSLPLSVGAYLSYSL